MATKNAWEKFLSTTRIKDLFERSNHGNKLDNYERDEVEKDYGRVLFSTPYRRLADKTQVFPLEKNDSVRTRLTHSGEVASLARNFGINIAENLINNLETSSYSDIRIYIRRIPALLATIGLAHDIGNPPFGHQGEVAIRNWIRKKNIFNGDFFKSASSKQISNYEQMREDYLNFDGNAQTFRVLSRLQILPDNYGLNLTSATLAAMIKYPHSSLICAKVNKSKFGFFFSEQDIVEKVWEETGLKEGYRHPLTYFMEASDDIAYSIVDLEDAVKKQIISFDDIIAELSKESSNEAISTLSNAAKEKNQKYKSIDALSHTEVSELSIQRLRALIMDSMVKAVLEKSKEIDWADILETKNLLKESGIIEISNMSVLCSKLKKIGSSRAYKHPSVTRIELDGYIVITRLMDFFWESIINRDNIDDIDSERSDPFSKYVYNLISENYRRIAVSNNELPIRYREVQLLVDMISGMTDSYAVDLYQNLNELRKRYPGKDV